MTKIEPSKAEVPEQSKAKRREEAQARTEALWPEIAVDLGLDGHQARFRPMRVNSRFIDRRCVLDVRLSNGQELVLRADFEDRRIKRIQNIIARQRRLSAALADVPGVSVPQVLWQHPSRFFTVMEFAKGETAFRELDLADLGFGRRAEVLHRIGRAVADMHRCSATGPRKFWPKFNLDKVSARAEAARTGDSPIRRQPKFLGLCAYLHRAGRRARGVSFDGALEHGDLHFRNVLMDEKTVSFIDFANFSNDIPQNDLANLWVANCPDHQAPIAEPSGYGRVREADWEAFLAGYGRDVREDPVFQFFYAMRVFRTWQRVPVPGDAISQKGEEMLEGLIDVTNWLLAHEPG
ncbi:aminoglycoside phosphotransferase family protein [Tritonibacter litoralis]|uniref:aminoglycoside phosphotransferase family protein n=1 Tax=Tritonibacter litoralis TaxID=2662264 RepID=UPI001885627C|nr:aminoglycoside phosphotransferase family protein [Tritonibacter litoralis]